MAQTGFFHHIGTFLLLSAAILLIITCISAPVVHDIAILKVELGSSHRESVTFGTFGYCHNDVNGGDGDNCSPSTVGYSPAAVMNSIDGTKFSDYAVSTTSSLTKSMILHPIAAGLSFIAFMLALGAGTLGSFFASLVALLAFLVTTVAMVIDFVLFSIIRSNVNDNGTGASAYYSSAAWTILVSAICSLIGTIVVFLTCCSGRMHRRRAAPGKHDGYAPPPRRQWF